MIAWIALAIALIDLGLILLFVKLQIGVNWQTVGFAKSTTDILTGIKEKEVKLSVN